MAPTSVLDENGVWVVMEPNKEQLLDCCHSTHSDGSSVQFDEYGRPLSFTTTTNIGCTTIAPPERNTDDDVDDDFDPDYYDVDGSSHDDDDGDDDDESATNAGVHDDNDDENAYEVASDSGDEDDDDENNNCPKFDEKAYFAKIEEEIAKEEQLAAQRIEQRQQSQKAVIGSCGSDHRCVVAFPNEEEEETEEEDEENDTSDTKECGNALLVRFESERLIESSKQKAADAEKEAAEAECIATAAEAAQLAMLVAALSKPELERLEAEQLSCPVPNPAVSQEASEKESIRFEMEQKKVQDEVAYKFRSQQLAEQHKHKLHFVSKSTEEERQAAADAKSWGHSPLLGMVSVTRNKTKQQCHQRPQPKSLSRGRSLHI